MPSKKLEPLMRMKRKLEFGEKDTFRASSLRMRSPDCGTAFFGTTFIVIMIVPTIALLVGAIVIMNIMLVAVTERTKEIGIRKSLGARQSDILKQFLLESATLAAIGGVIGLIIAEIIGVFVSRMFIATVIPWYAIVISIGVSAAVGIVAGLFPAWKLRDSIRSKH
jgi:putative ABC transport system permease protein